GQRVAQPEHRPEGVPDDLVQVLGTLARVGARADAPPTVLGSFARLRARPPGLLGCLSHDSLPARSSPSPPRGSLRPPAARCRRTRALRPRRTARRTAPAPAPVPRRPGCARPAPDGRPDTAADRPPSG